MARISAMSRARRRSWKSRTKPMARASISNCLPNCRNVPCGRAARVKALLVRKVCSLPSEITDLAQG